MDAPAYAAFTRRLVDTLSADDDVVGLVALGSMAGVGRQPDEWSDHDFWIITRGHAADRLRQDLRWLPNASHITVAYTETAHGKNVLFDDGHFAEFAVFTEDELRMASANDYRVLIDRGRIEEMMQDIVASSTDRATPTRDATAATFGKFIGQTAVGLMRAGRGERMSANWLIRGWALFNLLTLIRDHATPRSPDVDNLDPLRRIERTHPELAATLTEALRADVVTTARVLLDVAEAHLAPVLPAYSPDAIEVVRQLADRAAASGAELRQSN